MEKLSTSEKKHVAVHEFGHTLGLGHNTSSILAVMTDSHNFPIKLTYDDIDSYNSAAKLY